MKKHFTLSRLTGILFGLLLLSGLSGCSFTELGITSRDAASNITETKTSEPAANFIAEPISTPEPTPIPTPEPTPPPEATLMALGDNLMHMGIVNTGRRSDGTYNYDFLFEDLSDFIAQADISVINQETIFGGNHLGYSGYPYFNSPTEVGDAIIDSGFDIVLQATNHTLDQKQSGVEHCLSYWKNHPEILMIGLHDKYEENTPIEDRIPLITANGITFAVLNYTYGPNAEILPSYAKGCMDILCDYNPSNGALDFTKINPQVLEEIEAADRLADAVIVFPHWGVEYSTAPSKYQQQFARQMTEAGADVIIGAHPHVVQPVEWITSENGNECLCYYSLGNYVSTQKDPISMLENMAWVTFRKTDEGTYVVKESSGSIPLVCQYSAGPLRFQAIYLLEEYTQESADKHGIRQWGQKNLYVEDLKKWSAEILGDSVKSAAELTGLR